MSINNGKTFEVTENHIKLLQRMYIGYNDYCEFGAPVVNPKRPYGNSDVYGDIAEILGVEAQDDSDEDYHDWTSEQRDQMRTLHKEMETVLQILVRNLSIEPGRYQTEGAYDVEWSKV